jgi:hypothetical protein
MLRSRTVVVPQLLRRHLTTKYRRTVVAETFTRLPPHFVHCSMLFLRLPVAVVNVQIGDGHITDAGVTEAETKIQLPRVKGTLCVSAGISR